MNVQLAKKMIDATAALYFAARRAEHVMFATASTPFFQQVANELANAIIQFDELLENRNPGGKGDAGVSKDDDGTLNCV